MSTWESQDQTIDPSGRDTRVAARLACRKRLAEEGPSALVDLLDHIHLTPHVPGLVKRFAHILNFIVQSDPPLGISPDESTAAMYST